MICHSWWMRQDFQLKFSSSFFLFLLFIMLSIIICIWCVGFWSMCVHATVGQGMLQRMHTVCFFSIIHASFLVRRCCRMLLLFILFFSTLLTVGAFAWCINIFCIYVYMDYRSIMCALYCNSHPCTSIAYLQHETALVDSMLHICVVWCVCVCATVALALKHWNNNNKFLRYDNERKDWTRFQCECIFRKPCVNER